MRRFSAGKSPFATCRFRNRLHASTMLDKPAPFCCVGVREGRKAAGESRAIGYASATAPAEKQLEPGRVVHEMLQRDAQFDPFRRPLSRAARPLERLACGSRRFEKVVEFAVASGQAFLKSTR